MPWVVGSALQLVLFFVLFFNFSAVFVMVMWRWGM